MKNKILALTLCLSFFLVDTLTAQKMLSDGTVTYQVSVTKGKDVAGIAQAFDGASLVVSFKGTQVRSDLKNNVRQQTIFYNSKDGSAVILKESGAEKYMINLAPAQWVQYNKKYLGAKFTLTDESKVIQGFSCKKATAVLADGSSIEVYYYPDYKPVASGYEYVFKDLPGLPLEYEINSGNISVQYLATSLQMAPVNASRFDLPKSGYKLLDYKQ